MKRLLTLLFTLGCLSCDGFYDSPKIIPADPNFFINRPTERILGIESFKDTLDGKEIFLRPDSLRVNLQKGMEYLRLNSLKIKMLRKDGAMTSPITYDEKQVYSIEEINPQK